MEFLVAVVGGEEVIGAVFDIEPFSSVVYSVYSVLGEFAVDWCFLGIGAH